MPPKSVSAAEVFVDAVTQDVKTKADAKSEGELLSHEKKGARCDALHEGPAAKLSVKNAPAVVRAVDAFWVGIHRDFQLDVEDETSTICEKEYTYLHLRVQKAVLQDWNKAEACAIAAEEFTDEIQKCASLKPRQLGMSELRCDTEKEDGSREMLQAKRKLDYTSFFDAVYEIVDSWTDSVDAAEYARFLELLLSRITCAETGAFLPLEKISYCPSLETYQHTAVDCCGTWDASYVGGVGAGDKKTLAKLSNYEFSKDGHTVLKSVDKNKETISVVRSSTSFDVGVVTRIRVRVECVDGSLAKHSPAGDLDIGISTVSKAQRGSRPGDDGCSTEFCITAPRPLPEESRARCHRNQLLVGDVVTLIVNLKTEEATPGSGTYGDGRLEFQVNDKYVCDVGGCPLAWSLPIIGTHHQKYHVVAAVRTPGIAMTFL